MRDLYTVKYHQQYRPFLAAEFSGKRKPSTRVSTENHSHRTGPNWIKYKIEVGTHRLIN